MFEYKRLGFRKFTFWGLLNPMRLSWVYKKGFGPGAGYKGGRTFYVGWNTGYRRWHNTFRGAKIPILQIGFTRNANIVPYVYH